jgi:hypothetical protein
MFLSYLKWVFTLVHPFVSDAIEVATDLFCRSLASRVATESEILQNPHKNLVHSYPSLQVSYVSESEIL